MKEFYLYRDDVRNFSDSAWELLGDGQGIRWPELDEDLSVDGLLKGSRAPGSSRQAG